MISSQGMGMEKNVGTSTHSSLPGRIPDLWQEMQDVIAKVWKEEAVTKEHLTKPRSM
jgi:hypothetical protein